MSTITYVVLACTLLPGAAPAEEALTKAEKLGNAYTFYLKAQNCAEQGISLGADDIAKLTVAMKQYAHASGLSQAERDTQWEFAKRTHDLVATNKEWCDTARNFLSEAFPSILPSNSDNPF